MTRSKCIRCGVALDSKQGHKKKYCPKCHRIVKRSLSKPSWMPFKYKKR